jgi:pyridoxamine 5'-phosphate oxidase-like protein
MSIPVPSERLRAEIESRGWVAYLVTVSDEGSPHAVHVGLRWDGGALVADVGRRTATNAIARPLVSLLLPVRTQGDYSLIIDGTATVGEDNGAACVRVTPSKAVLHRPAVEPDPTSSCAADCVPLLPKSS